MSQTGDPFYEAQIFEQKNQFGQAAEKYREALSLETGDQAAAYQGLAHALVRLQEFQAAEEACHNALDLDPNLTLAHSLLGYLYRRQKKYSEAESELQIARQMNPENLFALTHSADLYHELNRDEDATKMLEKAVEVAPNNVEGRIGLANWYADHEKFQLAFHQLRQAITISPFHLRTYIVFTATLQIAFGLWLKRNYLPGVGLGFGLILIAAFAPDAVSIVAGVLLTVELLIAVLISIFLLRPRQNSARFLLAVLFMLFSCGLYWMVVWGNIAYKAF